MADGAAPASRRAAAPPPCRAARPAGSHTRTRPGCGRGRIAASPRPGSGTRCGRRSRRPRPARDAASSRRRGSSGSARSSRSGARSDEMALQLGFRCELRAAASAAASADGRRGSARTAPRSRSAPISSSMACLMSASGVRHPGMGRGFVRFHGSSLPVRRAFLHRRRRFSIACTACRLEFRRRPASWRTGRGRCARGCSPGAARPVRGLRCPRAGGRPPATPACAASPPR